MTNGQDFPQVGCCQGEREQAGCCQGEREHAVMLARAYLTTMVANISLNSWFTWTDCTWNDDPSNPGPLPRYGMVKASNCSCLMYVARFRTRL
jgi:hypothetical protein